MKHTQLCLRLLAVLAIITTSCSGGSESVASDPTAVPATEVPFAPTPQPAATPTPEPAAVIVSDQDRIDAALASLEAAPGADMIAYDVLDTSVDGDNVTITVCGWTGDTVFDAVYEALYATTADANGVVSAAEINTPRGAGECLNTTLIDTAIDTINQFEAYWKDVIRNPTTFSTVQGSEILTAEALATAEGLTADFVRDDVYVDGRRLDGLAGANLIAPLLFRRSGAADTSTLEFIVCREMNDDYGIYRAQVLIDDGGRSTGAGTHSIDAYELRHGPTGGSWRIALTDSLIWGDCFRSGDWAAGGLEWRGGDVGFVEIER